MNFKMTIKVMLAALITFSFFSSRAQRMDDASREISKEFKGVIKLDVRQSTADWTPYLHKKAPFQIELCHMK